jgi:hypothetical protein
MCRNSSAEEFGGPGTLYQTWRFLARYSAPVGILLVLFHAIA